MHHFPLLVKGKVNALTFVTLGKGPKSLQAEEGIIIRRYVVKKRME